MNVIKMVQEEMEFQNFFKGMELYKKLSFTTNETDQKEFVNQVSEKDIQACIQRKYKACHKEYSPAGFITKERAEIQILSEHLKQEHSVTVALYLENLKPGNLVQDQIEVFKLIPGRTGSIHRMNDLYAKLKAAKFTDSPPDLFKNLFSGGTISEDQRVNWTGSSLNSLRVLMIELTENGKPSWTKVARCFKYKNKEFDSKKLSGYGKGKGSLTVERQIQIIVKTANLTGLISAT